MAQDIVQIRTMGDALRNTGYKDIECAMSEIVDNSVQAEATDIFVIISDKLNERSGRRNICEIAFLDNGCGMDESILGGCLGIGVTTRGDRKGMGRFGVGLPQASLYACPHVEVYSWQEGYENCQMVVLDINKVKSGEQKVINDPEKASIPEAYQNFLNYKIKLPEGGYEAVDFTKSGTLVIWRDCDRVVPKTTNCLIERLKFALGQKFRYFISEDQCRIRLIPHGNQTLGGDVLPNDPLMLLEDNLVLGNPDKPGEVLKGRHKAEGFSVPVFRPFTDEKHPEGIVVLPIKYVDPEEGTIKESNVEIRFSIVKDIFYDKTAIPGSTVGDQPMGKHVKMLEGISIVRANREIDFGQFDFYENVNQPQHRWWGCEIRFMPELDEAFGVANNKQHVELRRVDSSDYEGDEVQPVWSQLYDVVYETIKEMYKTNKETREGTRSAKDVISPTSTIINNAENEDEDGIKGAAEINRESITEDELFEKKRESLVEQGIDNPTDDEVRAYMANKGNILYKSLGKMGPIFDYGFALGSCDVTINLEHVFYTDFLEGVFQEDPDVKTAFELFIYSLVKVISDTNRDQEEQNDKLMTRWNEKLRRCIDEMRNYAKG